MRSFHAIAMGSLVGLLLGLACHPTPGPTPTPPDADASVVALDSASLCAHLSKLPSGESCPEATVATCAVAFDRGEAVTVIDRPCLARAASAAEARACGSFVTCPQGGAGGDISATVPSAAPSSSARPRFR